jgi:subtilisin family serine protease
LNTAFSLWFIAHLLSYKPTLNVIIIDSGVTLPNPKITSYIPKEYKSSLYEGDRHNHGTVVAEIIANQACPGVRIYPCKFVINEFGGSLDACLKQAIVLNPDLVNLSAGGTDSKFYEQYLISRILADGKSFIIAAAGNNGDSIEQGGYYPAAYFILGGIFENIVPIGNIDKRSNQRVYNRDLFSNYASYLNWSHSDKLSGTSGAAAQFTADIIALWCSNKTKSKLDMNIKNR